MTGYYPDANPEGRGEDPRHPLQIVEVDEEKICVKKETVTIIDRREKDDPPIIRFSNFSLYENRKTLNFVLTMPRFKGCNMKRKDYTSDSYCYDIKLPED